MDLGLWIVLTIICGELGVIVGLLTGIAWAVFGIYHRMKRG